MDQKTVKVSCCSECPFLLSFVDSKTQKEKHFCGESYTFPTPPEVAEPDKEVPDFCPLRSASVLVELENN